MPSSSSSSSSPAADGPSSSARGAGPAAGPYTLANFRDHVVSGKHADEITRNIPAIRVLDETHPGLLADAARAAATMHDSPLTLRALLTGFPSLCSGGLLAEAAYDAGRLDCFAECLRHNEAYPTLLRASRFVQERANHFFHPGKSADERFQMVFSLLKMLHEIFPFSPLLLSSVYHARGLEEIQAHPKKLKPLLRDLRALRERAVFEGRLPDAAAAEAATPFAQLIAWPLYLFCRYVVFDVADGGDGGGDGDHHVWAQMISFGANAGSFRSFGGARDAESRRLFCEAAQISLRFFAGKDWKEKIELHMHTYCNDERLSRPHERLVSATEVATVQKLDIPYLRFRECMKTFLCALQAVYTVTTVPLAELASSPEDQDRDTLLVHGLFGKYLFRDHEMNLPGLRFFAHNLAFWFAHVCPRARSPAEWDARRVEQRAAHLVRALGPDVFTVYGFLLTEFKFQLDDLRAGVPAETRARKYDAELFSLSALLRVFGEACRQSAARPRAAHVLGRWLSKKKRASFLAHNGGAMFEYFLAGVQEAAFQDFASAAASVVDARVPRLLEGPLLVALMDVIHVQYRAEDEDKDEDASQNALYVRWLYHVHNCLHQGRADAVRALHRDATRAMLRRALEPVRGETFSLRTDADATLDIVQSLRTRAFGLVSDTDANTDADFEPTLRERMAGVSDVGTAMLKLCDEVAPRLRAAHDRRRKLPASFLPVVARMLAPDTQLLYLFWRFVLDQRLRGSQYEAPEEIRMYMEDARAFLDMSHTLLRIPPGGGCLAVAEKTRIGLRTFFEKAFLGRKLPLDVRWRWFQLVADAFARITLPEVAREWIRCMPEPRRLLNRLARRAASFLEDDDVVPPNEDGNGNRNRLVALLLAACATTPRQVTDLIVSALRRGNKSSARLASDLLGVCAVRYPDYLPLLRVCVNRLNFHARDAMIAYAALFRRHLLTPAQRAKIEHFHPAAIDALYNCLDEERTVPFSVARILFEADRDLRPAAGQEGPAASSSSSSEHDEYEVVERDVGVDEGLLPAIREKSAEEDEEEEKVWSCSSAPAISALTEIARRLLRTSTTIASPPETIQAVLNKWVERSRFAAADLASSSCATAMRSLISVVACAAAYIGNPHSQEGEVLFVASPTHAHVQSQVGLFVAAVQRAVATTASTATETEVHQFLFEALAGLLPNLAARLRFLRRHVYYPGSTALESAKKAIATAAAATASSVAETSPHLRCLLEHVHAGRFRLLDYFSLPRDRTFFACTVVYSPGYRRQMAKTLHILLEHRDSALFREKLADALRRGNHGTSKLFERVRKLHYVAREVLDDDSSSSSSGYRALRRDMQRLRNCVPGLAEQLEGFQLLSFTEDNDGANIKRSRDFNPSLRFGS